MPVRADMLLPAGGPTRYATDVRGACHFRGCDCMSEIMGYLALGIVCIACVLVLASAFDDR
jgi:hypothetical protein